MLIFFIQTKIKISLKSSFIWLTDWNVRDSAGSRRGGEIWDGCICRTFKDFLCWDKSTTIFLYINALHCKWYHAPVAIFLHKLLSCCNLLMMEGKPVQRFFYYFTLWGNISVPELFCCLSGGHTVTCWGGENLCPGQRCWSTGFSIWIKQLSGKRLWGWPQPNHKTL